MINTDSRADLAAFFKEGLEQGARLHKQRVRGKLLLALLIAGALWGAFHWPKDRVIPIAIGVGNPTGDRGYGDPE